MNKVVETRQRLGMTQLSLAVKSGLHPSGVSKIEKGMRCTQHTAQRIATVLEADVREVFPEFATYRDGPGRPKGKPNRPRLEIEELESAIIAANESVKITEGVGLVHYMKTEFNAGTERDLSVIERVLAKHLPSSRP